MPEDAFGVVYIISRTVISEIDRREEKLGEA